MARKQSRDVIKRATFVNAVSMAKRVVSSAIVGQEHVTEIRLADGLMHMRTDEGQHVAVPLTNVGYLHYERVEVEALEPVMASGSQQRAYQQPAPAL